MLLFDYTRFSDFAVPERIATNVLADRLTRLEAAKIITKKQDTTLKNQNTYQVTDKGRDLTEVLVASMLWGLKYDEQTLVAKDFIARISDDLHKVTDEVRIAIKTNTFENYRAREMGIGRDLYK